MDTKTIKGTVEAVNAQYKSVTIGGQRYSGAFTFKGQMPNKGDDIEMEVVSSVSKKDGKTYWNILDIKVLKQNTTMTDVRESKSMDMQISYAKDLLDTSLAHALSSGNEKFDLVKTAELCAKAIIKIKDTLDKKEEVKVEKALETKTKSAFPKEITEETLKDY